MFLDRISQHSFLPTFVTPGGVVLDLGFNKGQFSYAMIAKYDSRVVAVEPVADFCAEAQEDPNLTLINAAVLSNDRKVSMLTTEGYHLSATVLEHDTVSSIHDTKKASSIDVEGVTLDSLVAAAGSDTVDLVKMDIEGAELEVLPSADPETLARIKQIAVEFHDFWYPELSEKTENVKRQLQNHGFDMIRFTPNNKDVLFINKAHIKLGPLHRAWVAYVLRNINGFRRMLLIPLRRVGLVS